MDNFNEKWMKWMGKDWRPMTKKGYISKEGTPKQWLVHIFSTIK